ncbi:hypothetical protein LUZ60_015966 [Juncus effusus]|nr:hypothetical protein LUZ60_015966 [Juncus effusus]
MADDDGSDLFLSLPDDAFSLVAGHLSHPRHLLSLGLASKRLFNLTLSCPSAWVALLSSSILPSHLQCWQSLSCLSYVSICRFVYSVSKLRCLWAHQNPELGNLVYPIWGFLSLVFVRIIPQVVSKSVLYAPVLEIHCDLDGKPGLLFLHGENDSIHVGSVFSEILSDPNVLLLEADFSSNNEAKPSLFGKLAFGDRRTLLDILSSKSVIKLPNDLKSAPIFPKSDQDFKSLSDRREALISMHKQINGGLIPQSSLLSDSSLTRNKSFNPNSEKRKSISSLVRDSFLQLIGKNSNSNPSSSNTTGETNNKHLPLTEFLKTGENNSLSLSLRASQMRLTTYRSWPNMHENRYALYKLPLTNSKPGTEYSGLWAGSFGWPPVLLTNKSKQSKALFLLLLSYEGSTLIATKVLEGNHYVLHPNGSSMFTAQLEISSEDSFPWETEVGVRNGFQGEGISSGYGFRYPGSKPGSLFELESGLIAFVWRESKMVLVLERVELDQVLRSRGERVAALSGVLNFAYLTKSYSNVFAGFSPR